MMATRARTQRARRSSLRIALPIMIGAAVMIMIAGCSSDSDQSGGSAQAAPQASSSSAAGSAGGNGQGGQGGARPGASGLIADLDGKTLQVQSASSQTTVTYTGKTKISKTTSGTTDDLATGLCATVRSDDGSGSESLPSSMTATSITVTAADDGSCSGGFGGTGGSRPTDVPSGMPSGAPGQGGSGQGRSGQGGSGQGGSGQGGSGQGGFPSGRPSGAPSDAAGRMGTLASGKITKVDGSTFVIKARQRGSSSSTSDVTVTVGKDADLTVTKTASASAVKKNECVSAFGKSDDTGAVTATTMTLSASKNGQCTMGFGGMPGQRSNG